MQERDSKNRFKEGIGEHVGYWKGKKFSIGHRKELSKAKKGRHYPKLSKALKGRQAPWMKGENSPNWKGGKSFEPYTIEFNEELKELIRCRDGYKCQRCSCPEIENDRKLLIHHIDYDKKNCQISNLISLCTSCNTKVNFNRVKWTKYFHKKLEKFRKLPTQLNFRFQRQKNATPV